MLTRVCACRLHVKQLRKADLTQVVPLGESPDLDDSIRHDERVTLTEKEMKYANLLSQSHLCVVRCCFAML